MFSPDERKRHFDTMVKRIESSKLVEGIVQIGSGVFGFSDEFSDIDFMVATSNVNDAEPAKNILRQFFSEINPAYIKEKQFSKDIFLLIVLLENNLEFNVSIVPREFLTVKSPLWKVIVDKTGFVTKKMKSENQKFENNPVKYETDIDVPFEFVYCALSLHKALRRTNVIYALKMLEKMRTYTLYLQAMNENKKLHQFKAYDTLEPSFIKKYLTTYPENTNVRDLKDSAENLIRLFTSVLHRSTIFSMDDALQQLLNESI
ncbi:aminoglycoside 6-adenylyltransferase [Salinibacillus xinjiangensis]|uniref:Polymerase nucleotidyl transferase domain-containing protein n=1 Tax=Salinibacillus xinjiangensis TaxID=1229268 RepID=A0A6G1X2S8_9BACI|nr:aminoglycoside 6-adenylyltransferase [Salinibacillus xinjiangensis]MRG85297.1 hypothetical protein [Salinibacillus xinjiangensis]